MGDTLRLASLLAALLLAVLCSAAHAQGIALTDCNNATFVDVEVHLTGDLDCTGAFNPDTPSATIVLRNATLDLRGFTISRTDDPWPANHKGILCRDCRLIGPGTVTGFNIGVGVIGKKGSTISGVTVTGNDIAGIGDSGILVPSRLHLIDATVSGNGISGVVVERLLVENSVIRDHPSGGIFTLGKTTVVGSTIENNGDYGVYVNRSRAIVEGTVVSGHETGIVSAQRAKISDTTVTANTSVGLDAPRGAILRSSEVTNNGLAGVLAVRGRVKALGSSFSGNNQSVECGTSVTCADLVTRKRPSVRRSVCETSLVLGSSESWGVCSLD